MLAGVSAGQKLLRSVSVFLEKSLKYPETALTIELFGWYRQSIEKQNSYPSITQQEAHNGSQTIRTGPDGDALNSVADSTNPSTVQGPSEGNIRALQVRQPEAAERWSTINGQPVKFIDINSVDIRNPKPSVVLVHFSQVKGLDETERSQACDIDIKPQSQEPDPALSKSTAPKTITPQRSYLAGLKPLDRPSISLKNQLKTPKMPLTVACFGWYCRSLEKANFCPLNRFSATTCF